MFKVLLILMTVFGPGDSIDVTYSSPNSYASIEACRNALEDDLSLENWLDSKVEEFLALDLPGMEGKKDLTYYCYEENVHEQKL